MTGTLSNKKNIPRAKI